MRIISNGEVIGDIITNHTMTLEQALKLIGAEFVNPERPDDPDVILYGKSYWMEDLKIEG